MSNLTKSVKVLGEILGLLVGDNFITPLDNEMIKHLYSNRNQLIETLINDINELEVFTQEIKDINTYILQMDKIYEIYNLEKGTSVGEIKCFIYTLNAYYRFLKRIDIRFKEKLGIA